MLFILNKSHNKRFMIKIIKDLRIILFEMT